MTNYLTICYTIKDSFNSFIESKFIYYYENLGNNIYILILI